MLCHTLSLFIFSLCPHVTVYKTLTSLSTAFIKGRVGFLQLLKWPCHTSFFTHVEPYIDYGKILGSLNFCNLSMTMLSVPRDQSFVGDFSACIVKDKQSGRGAVTLSSAGTLSSDDHG